MKARDWKLESIIKQIWDSFVGGNEATNKHKHPDNALLGALTQCGQEYAIAILALGSWSSKPRIDFIGKIFLDNSEKIVSHLKK